MSCWQLKVGKKHEVFLTTAMGFVRYSLNDVVNNKRDLTLLLKRRRVQTPEVDGFLGQPGKH